MKRRRHPECRCYCCEQRRKEAESDLYNALTAGLYGLIHCVRSIREDTKLIKELREKIRQEEALAQQRAAENEAKRP